MITAMEALLSVGKCREMPVVGLVRGVRVIGVIVGLPLDYRSQQDEITRKPITQSSQPKRMTRPKDSRQSDLTAHGFSHSPKTRSGPLPRTHAIRISDSKTRSSATIPSKGDDTAGRLQVMLYKELLDALLLSALPSEAVSHSPSAETGVFESSQEHPRERTHPQDGPSQSLSDSTLLPSETVFSFDQFFETLDLDPDVELSETFLNQIRPVVRGNDPQFRTSEARSLTDLLQAWKRYVSALGLGTPDVASTRRPALRKKKHPDKEMPGTTSNKLSLVYRRAEGVKREKKSRKNDQEGLVVRGMPTSVTEKINVQSANERSSAESDGPLRDADPLQQMEAEATFGDAAAERATPGGDAVDASMKAIENEANGRVENGVDAVEAETQRSEPEEQPIEEDERVGPDVIEGPNPIEAAVEGEATIPLSSQPDKGSTSSSPAVRGAVDVLASSPKSVKPSTASGGIIGIVEFDHSPLFLRTHLDSVMRFWMGERPPEGVSLQNTRRCQRCEFEEGCE